MDYDNTTDLLHWGHIDFFLKWMMSRRDAGILNAKSHEATIFKEQKFWGITRILGKIWLTAEMKIRYTL